MKIKWHNVKGHLPPHQTECLAFARIQTYHGKKFITTQVSFDMRIGWKTFLYGTIEVFYWTELPEPPKMPLLVAAELKEGEGDEILPEESGKTKKPQ
jgi:hypothetical protein